MRLNVCPRMRHQTFSSYLSSASARLWYPAMHSDRFFVCDSSQYSRLIISHFNDINFPLIGDNMIILTCECIMRIYESASRHLLLNDWIILLRPGASGFKGVNVRVLGRDRSQAIVHQIAFNAVMCNTATIIHSYKLHSSWRILLQFPSWKLQNWLAKFIS